jgi:hypothetical protein
MYDCIHVCTGVYIQHLNKYGVPTLRDNADGENSTDGGQGVGLFNMNLREAPKHNDHD